MKFFDDDRYDIFPDEDDVQRDHEMVEDIRAGLPSDDALAGILAEWRREVALGLNDPSVEMWRDALDNDPSLVYVYAASGFPFERQPTVRGALRDLVTAAVLYPLVRLIAAIPLPRPRPW